MKDDQIDSRLFARCLDAQEEFNDAAAAWREFGRDRAAAESRLLDRMTTSFRLISKTRRLLEARGGGAPDIIADPVALAIFADIDAGMQAGAGGAN